MHSPRDQDEIRRNLIGAGFKSPEVNVSMDGWDCYDQLGNFPAIYLFLSRPFGAGANGLACISYVGMAVNLSRRLSCHEVRRKLYEAGYTQERWFMKVPREKLRSVEAKFITEFEPPYNSLGKKQVGFNG